MSSAQASATMKGTFRRLATSISASAEEDWLSPSTMTTLSRVTSRSNPEAALSTAAVSSKTISSFLPRTPPLELTYSVASLMPSSKAWPVAARRSRAGSDDADLDRVLSPGAAAQQQHGDRDRGDPRLPVHEQPPLVVGCMMPSPSAAAGFLRWSRSQGGRIYAPMSPVSMAAETATTALEVKDCFGGGKGFHLDGDTRAGKPLPQQRI